MRDLDGTANTVRPVKKDCRIRIRLLFVTVKVGKVFKAGLHGKGQVVGGQFNHHFPAGYARCSQTDDYVWHNVEK